MTKKVLVRKKKKHSDSNSSPDSERTQSECTKSESESQRTNEENNNIDILEKPTIPKKKTQAPKSEPRKRKESTWLLALREWNSPRDSWAMPKKNTKDYMEVKSIQNRIIQSRIPKMDAEMKPQKKELTV